MYWTYVHSEGSTIRYRVSKMTQYENDYIVELVDGEWPDNERLIDLCLGKPSYYINGTVTVEDNYKNVAVNL